MKIQNVGSKENLGVKFKDGIRTRFCLNSCLKATGIFIILLSQDGLESDCPETNSKQLLPKINLKK